MEFWTTVARLFQPSSSFQGSLYAEIFSIIIGTIIMIILIHLLYCPKTTKILCWRTALSTMAFARSTSSELAPEQRSELKVGHKMKQSSFANRDDRRWGLVTWNKGPYIPQRCHWLRDGRNRGFLGFLMYHCFHLVQRHHLQHQKNDHEHIAIQ